VLLRQLGDAEVEHLDEVAIVAAPHQHHVVRLEVTMDDANRMRRRQRAPDAIDDVQRAPRPERPRLHHLGQRAPVEKLHHEVRRAARKLAEVEHIDDVLVVNLRRGARLVEEARHRLRVGRHLAQEHLDRDLATYSWVLGQIDGPHAAFADLPHDDVVSDRATDHVRRSYRRSWGKVA
jgi:hypothetical protein